MEKKIWSIEELPIGAEVLIQNQAWVYDTAVLKFVHKWKGFWITETSDDLLIFDWEFEQVDNNRFNLLQDENETDKEVQ